jgi:predicted ribosome quality control (RQC) complex YloA/Tae2 family protein
MDAARQREDSTMTYLFEEGHTQVTDDELLIPGGLGSAHPDLADQLARTEEARADERSKRLHAEATAEQLAQLIAAEHVNVTAERERAERAEAALAKAERLAREMADLVQAQSDRADAAEESSRQALTAYLDDPFRPIALPPRGRANRLRAKLNRAA